MITLSVVIPTHNRIGILQKALRYLDNGSVLPDEVIIVDDASDPSAQSQIEVDLYRFPIKFIRFDMNRGAASARNAGIRMAQSRLLLLMDDDIWPDHNMIYYHKVIHEQNPQLGYGVSGRVIFDPGLKRTPLLHFLEEYGFYRWLTKPRERELYSTGILTANISFKGEFLKDKNLFDENFPYNRNEDTEFGLRLMDYGFEPRFHSCPSAIHHSPLTFKDYNNILMQSGYSKAYWSNKKPDDTIFCLYLSKWLRRTEQKTVFQQTYNHFVDTLGDEFFLSDISECRSEVFEEFRLFMPIAEDWVQSINMVSAWKEKIPGFEKMSEEMKKGFNCKRREKAIHFIRKGFNESSNFFPAAILFADLLKVKKKYDEARHVLNAFKDSTWAMLKIGEIEYFARKYMKSFEIFLNVYERTNHIKAVEAKQREIATKWLLKISPKINYRTDKILQISKVLPTIERDLKNKIISSIVQQQITDKHTDQDYDVYEVSSRIKKLKENRVKIEDLNKVIGFQSYFTFNYNIYLSPLYRRLKYGIDRLVNYLSVKFNFKTP